MSPIWLKIPNINSEANVTDEINFSIEANSKDNSNSHVAAEFTGDGQLEDTIISEANVSSCPSCHVPQSSYRCQW